MINREAESIRPAAVELDLDQADDFLDVAPYELQRLGIELLGPEHLVRASVKVRGVASEAPIIRLVNFVMARAIERGASDIHFEPYEKELRVRYRIDGILEDVESPPRRLQTAILSRIKIMARLNPNFRKFNVPVNMLSGGQRQSVAIARAVYFNARILIMDEPTAALGPAETAQVTDLILQLKSEGIGIFLISHDIHDVFDLADRISVMLQGKLVGTVNKADVTKDEVLAMIIMGKHPGEVTQDDVKGLHNGD